MNVALESPRKRALTVHDYHRMGEAGILPADARMELIDGEIIDMVPIGSRHASLVSRLCRTLERKVGERALVWPQNPIRLGDLSEPEPDVSLLRPREDAYARAHPTADDVLLLIEVSDSTLVYDHRVKLPLYARHGIADVWIVDVDARRLDTFSELERGRYHAERTLSPERPDELAELRELRIGRLADIAVDLGELFRDID